MDRQRIAASGGVTLTAETAGPAGGPPVVLLHGGGQTRYAWGKACGQLSAQGYRTLSLDLRGHGESDWAPEGDYSLDAYADDLKAVCATLASPPAIIGASLGGMAALLAVGEGLPAQCLILVDVTPQLNQQGAARIGAFMNANPNGFANLEEAADAVAAYATHRPRPRDPSGLMRNLRRQENGRLYWHWDPKFLSGRGPRAPDTTERLNAAAASVSAPTLLVRGVLSDVVDAEAVENFRKLMPTAECVEVEGAGHMVAGDRNDAFNEAIFGFLAKTHRAKT